MSILPSSSGYGSDGPHLRGAQPRDTEPEKTSTSFSEEDGTLSLEASHAPLWGLEEVGGLRSHLDSWPSNLLKWSVLSGEDLGASLQAYLHHVPGVSDWVWQTESV